MYTTISGIHENGKILLQESAPTEKSMKVLVVFVEENNQTSLNQATVKQFTKDEAKQPFSERWQGQFKLTDKTGDARLDYLEINKNSGFIAWHSIANFFYLTAKGDSKQQNKKFIAELCDFLSIVAVSNQDLIVALEHHSTILKMLCNARLQ